MTCLNTSVWRGEDADEEVVSGNFDDELGGSNEADGDEDNDDVTDIFAIINAASGRKIPPAAAPRLAAAVFSSSPISSQAVQSNLVPDDAPLEQYILMPGNADGNGINSASAPPASEKELKHPRNIFYNLAAKFRRDVYDASEDEPVQKTRHSSKRQNRSSESEDESEGNAEQVLAEEEIKEPTMVVSDSTEQQKNTVNGINAKISDNHEVDDNEKADSASAEPQEILVPEKRDRDHPPLRETRSSKRKAQADSDEDSERQIEVPAIEKSAKPTVNSKKRPKKQKIDAAPADTASAMQKNSRKMRGTAPKPTHQLSESDDEDEWSANLAHSFQGKLQQIAQKPQRNLVEESRRLDMPPDEGVDSIPRYPTPEAQAQPAASEPGETKNIQAVSEEREELHSSENGHENGDESGDEIEDEVEGEAEEKPGNGPITDAVIKKMRDLMRNVGAGIENGKPSKQNKPEIGTKLGARISRSTLEAINYHKGIFKEGDMDACQKAHDSLDRCLDTIKKEVVAVVSSGLLEDRTHGLRLRMIKDLYAHSIPDLVELVSVSFETYKYDENDLRTPALTEIEEILGCLHDLCTIARKQPRKLQPKIPGCQLAGPTRRLYPVVRDLLKKCTGETKKRERDERGAEWQTRAPERKRKKQQELMAGNGFCRRRAPRRFKQPSPQPVPEEALTDIQKAAKAEKLAYQTAAKAKQADLHARRLAKEADVEFLDKSLAEEAEIARQAACSALEAAVEAEDRKVELALLVHLKPGPSQIKFLLERSRGTKPAAESTLKPKQALGRHGRHVPTTSEWSWEEMKIMVDGLQYRSGNEKYTMIEEYLPNRTCQEILDKAQEFQSDQIEAWHEKQRNDPSCKALPQWIHSISRWSE